MKGKKIFRLIIAVLTVFTCFAGYVTTNSIDAAESTVDVKWNPTTVSQGDVGSDDQNIILNPSSSGTYSMQADVSFNIKENYEPGEFAVTFPYALLTHKDNTPATYVLGDFVFGDDSKVQTSSTGWLYHKEENGDIKIYNTVAINPTGQTINFSMTYQVKAAQVPDNTDAALHVTVPAGITVQNPKVHFNTFARIKENSTSKVSERTLRKYPDENRGTAENPGTYFGLPESSFDFVNNYYQVFQAITQIEGSQTGQFTFTDTLHQSQSGATIIGMTNEGGSHDSLAIKDSGGVWNGGNTYTMPSAGSGSKSVWILVKYPKANYTENSDGETEIGSNQIDVKFKSDEDKEESSGTYNTKDLTIKKLSFGAGGGYGWSKNYGYNDGQYQNLQGILKTYRNKDVHISDFSYGEAYDEEKVKGSGQGFVFGDDAVFVQSQYGNTPNTNEIIQLTKNDYYFDRLIFNTKEYTLDETSANESNPVKPKDYLTSTGVVKVMVKSSENDTWHQYGADIPKSTLPDGTDYTVFNNTDADTTNDSTEHIYQWKFIATKYDYRVYFNAQSGITLKKNAPSIDKAINNQDANIRIENYVFMDYTDKDGNIIQFSKYGNTDTSKMDAAEYKAYQESTYLSGLFTAGVKDNENTAGDQLKVLDGTERHFRTSAWVELSGVNGQTSVHTTYGATNDPANAKANVTWTTTSTQWYPMSTASTEFNMNENAKFRLSREKGTIYQLLPRGLEYEANSAVAYGVSRSQTTADVDVTEIKNYQNSGRTLLKFDISNVQGNGVTLEQGNTYYPYSADADTDTPNADSYKASSITSGANAGSQSLQTGFSVTFKTSVTWKNLAAAKLTNSLVAYQDSDDNGALIGNFYANDRTIWSYATHDNIAENALETEEHRPGVTAKYIGELGDVMNHLATKQTNEAGVVTSPGTDTPTLSTIYNWSEFKPTVSTLSISGLNKEVAPAGATDYGNETTVNVGSKYTYKVTYGNGYNGDIGKIVLFDPIEKASDADTSWKGSFDSVDTTAITAMGAKPMVYYSTYDGFENGNVAKDYYNLTDPDQDWKLLEYDETGNIINLDKSKVTAIAFDCTHTTAWDGKEADKSLFTLKKDQELYAYINMVAPNSTQVGDEKNTKDSKTKPARNRAAATIEYSTGILQGEADVIIDPNYATKVNLVDNNRPVQVIKNDDTPNTAIVAGAKYVIKTAGKDDINCITDENGILKRVETDKKGTVATDDDEDVNTELRLPAGTYTLSETESPEGYELNETEYTVTITALKDDQGELTGKFSCNITYLKDRVPTELTLDDNDNYIVTDPMSRATLEVIKHQDTVDAEGQPDPTALQGVGFTLFTDKECTTMYVDEDGVTVNELKTDEKGQVTYKDLPSGTYYLKETNVPHGIVDPTKEGYDNTEKTTIYKVVSHLGKIKVTQIDTSIEDGTEQETELEMEDVKESDEENAKVIAQSTVLDNTRITRSISGNVFVDKNENGQFESDDERNVDGMKVALLDKDGKEVKDINGKLVEPVTTDTTGNYVFENIPQGEYQVVGYYDFDAYLVTKVNDPTDELSNLATLDDTDKTNKFAVIKDINTEDTDVENLNIGIIAAIDKVKKEVLLNGENVGAGTVDNPIKVKPGDKFTYIITVNNKATNREDIVPAYTVVDDVPEGLTIDSIDPNSTGTINGQRVLWEDVELATGKNEFVINVTVQEFSSATTSFVNIAYGARGDEDPEKGESSNPQYTEAVNPPKKVKTGDDTIITSSILASMFALLMGVLTLVTRKKETE